MPNPRCCGVTHLALAITLAVAARTWSADHDDYAPEGPAIEEATWSVDADHAPDDTLAFVATEGTWISVDVSPDGERILFDLLGHLYEMPYAGGVARRLTDGRSWNMFPRVSPDGTKLAFTSDRGGSNDLWVIDRGDEGELGPKNVSELEFPAFQGTWSRDGRHLYGTALSDKVRFPAYRFNLHGDKLEVVPAGARTPVNHFQEHPSNGLVYFAAHRGDAYKKGSELRTYDLETGETRDFLERPAGAVSPRLSPDGRFLAYVHRDDRHVVLVVHDLEARTERVVARGLDRGRIESSSFYGGYPNIAWHPSGAELVYSAGGGIRAVSVADGGVRQIPFEAAVERRVNRTQRVRLELPRERAVTRSHRWGVPTAHGFVFEALGDLHLLRPDGTRTNLTESVAHETNPVYDAERDRLYYASWTDDALGAVWVRRLVGGGAPRRLTARSSQYGAIAVAPDGETIAFVRGGGALRTGARVEGQTEFELCVRTADGEIARVTDVSFTGNRYARRPPTVRFTADGRQLLFTEFVDDKLTLKRIRVDGADEKVLYELPHATRAVVSPDLRWIAFREYHRTFVTPFEYAGKLVTVSAADKKGFAARVDPADGDFTEWRADSEALYWTRGSKLIEKPLGSILAEGSGSLTETDLAFTFDVDRPSSVIALTGVRVLTMNEGLEVLEGATIVIDGDHIRAVGIDVPVPPSAKVFDLTGRTVMPGMFDAHGHYGSPVSALNVIEQRLYGLHANLAYGVTTMYDVYGTTQKDFWVSDMLRAGKIHGPRIFSVGDPIFVTKYRSKMHRPIGSLEDAVEHGRFNRDHGATALKDYSNHTRAARQQLVAACRELGLNLVTESFGDPQMNLTQVVDGFTGIEHTMGLTPFYDDVVRLFAHTDIGMTPTLIVVYGGPAGINYFFQHEKLWEDGKLGQFYRRDELLRSRRPTHFWPDDFYHMEMAAELRKLDAAGVLLQMGAHGEKMGLGAHWEMEMFVHGGFEPHDAIRIATINGFRHHGLDHVLGSIEPGKLADLVVLFESPLEDIRNTRAIEYVMKNGVLYAGHDAARVYPEPQAAAPMYFLGTERRATGSP